MEIQVPAQPTSFLSIKPLKEKEYFKPKKISKKIIALKDHNKGQEIWRLLTIHHRLHPLIKTSIVNTKTMMNHFWSHPKTTKSFKTITIKVWKLKRIILIKKTQSMKKQSKKSIMKKIYTYNWTKTNLWTGTWKYTLYKSRWMRTDPSWTISKMEAWNID